MVICTTNIKSNYWPRAVRGGNLRCEGTRSVYRSLSSSTGGVVIWRSGRAKFRALGRTASVWEYLDDGIISGFSVR